MMRTVLVAVGLVLLVVGFGFNLVTCNSGVQPWGQLLGDNFWFARTLPFTIRKNLCQKKNSIFSSFIYICRIT